MKSESVVIADQNAAVNTFSGLVQIKCAWQFKKQNGGNPFSVVEEQYLFRKRKSEGFDVTKNSLILKSVSTLRCTKRKRNIRS